MSGGRSSFFGLRDSAGGGRPGAADQSMLLRALKLQALQKALIASTGKNSVNTHLHSNSAVNRVSYNSNQQAIQRTIFYNPV
jgi:hypothetical protein